MTACFRRKLRSCWIHRSHTNSLILLERLRAQIHCNVFHANHAAWNVHVVHSIFNVAVSSVTCAALAVPDSHWAEPSAQVELPSKNNSTASTAAHPTRTLSLSPLNSVEKHFYFHPFPLLLHQKRERGKASSNTAKQTFKVDILKHALWIRVLHLGICHRLAFKLALKD